MQGVLLAAGFGKRFDARQDKLLVNLEGKPVLWHSAKTLINVLPNSIAVIQPHQHQRRRILEALGFHIVQSARAKDGMGYAIADAVQASQAAKGWLVALADMPWVSSDLIQKVSNQIEHSETIVAPRYNKQRGHPVAFGAAWHDKLSGLTGDKGARDLFTSAPITWVDWHDDTIHRDVDIVDDLA